MRAESGRTTRAKCQREAIMTLQENPDMAENATHIPTGVCAVSNGIQSAFPYLVVADSYPPISTCVRVKASNKLGNFIPKYGTGTTVRCKAKSWNIANLGFLGDTTATSGDNLPKDLVKTRAEYVVTVPVIGEKTFATVSIPTPAGVYITGIWVNAYGSGSWWTGEAMIPQGQSYAPTVGTVNVALFNPEGFNVGASTLQLVVEGYKTNRPLKYIEVGNPACNEGARAYANWTKPDRFQMIGAFQVGVKADNWYPLCWGMAGNNGNTGFNWQRAGVANNSVVFAQARLMGQAAANNRTANSTKVVITGVQF